MILKEATKEAYGYLPEDLTQGSHKPVIVMCEDCGKILTVPKFVFFTLCSSCCRKGERNSNYMKLLPEEQRNSFCGCRKGKHHTEEAKKKMADARIGKKHSPETIIKLCISHKGNTYNIGRKASIETRRIMSKMRSGNKNPNWKGGISFEPYCIKFNRAFKQYIRSKFGNTCFLCGKSAKDNGNALDVHHVNYNKDCGCDNTECICVPLCRSCHMKTNFDRIYWAKKIMDLLDSGGGVPNFI